MASLLMLNAKMVEEAAATGKNSSVATKVQVRPQGIWRSVHVQGKSYCDRRLGCTGDSGVIVPVMSWRRRFRPWPIITNLRETGHQLALSNCPGNLVKTGLSPLTC